MKRREFVTLFVAAVAWPLATRAQQATTPLIGFLSSRSPNESEALVAAFRQGLAETGYVEGQNVHIAFRWAEGRYDRLPQLAAELVKSQVAVIASVGGSVSALAAKSATRTMPIVAIAGGDPIKFGLVASFNRPGGNITVVSPSSTLLSAKRLALLRELVPTASLIGVLLNPKLPDSAPGGMCALC
jgi:putative ABC transport system substrate-binding protein